MYEVQLGNFEIPQRRCNVYGCNGLMRATREMHYLNNGNRIFQCASCLDVKDDAVDVRAAWPVFTASLRTSPALN